MAVSPPVNALHPPVALKSLPDDFGAVRFSLNRADLWSSHLMDDVRVIHHRLSDDIHILNDLTNGLLTLLEAGPQTAASLHEHFLVAWGVTEDDCPPALIFRTLDDLDQAGLIRPLLSPSGSS